MKDRVDKGELSIEYCPTEWMLADYFTKTLQGKLFRVMRSVITGHKPLSFIREALIATKERIENGHTSKVVDVNIGGKERNNGNPS